jgi:hypothetical protein
MRGTAIAATRPPFSMESRTDAAGFPSRAAPIDLVVGHSNDRPRVQQRDSDRYSNPAAKMCTQSLLRVGYRKGSFQPELGIIYPAGPDIAHGTLDRVGGTHQRRGRVRQVRCSLIVRLWLMLGRSKIYLELENSVAWLNASLVFCGGCC